MSPPRNMGVKASLALMCLVGITLVTHTITNNHHVKTVIEKEQVRTYRNYTNHHHANKAEVSQSKQESLQKELPAVKEKNICESKEMQNFFTTIPYSFTEIAKDIDKPINTDLFLQCSKELSRIFDKLSASAFSPMKSGFNTNIERITAKYETDKERFSTLEAILKEEVSRNIHTTTSSASNEVLWLTRSLLFISVLFDNIEDEPTFHKAISIAYESTVRQYHNFIVRSLFSVIGKSVPSKEAAVEGFAMVKGDTSQAGYVKCLYKSMYIYNDALLDVCTNIEKMFQREASVEIMHRPPQ